MWLAQPVCIQCICFSHFLLQLFIWCCSDYNLHKWAKSTPPPNYPPASYIHPKFPQSGLILMVEKSQPGFIQDRGDTHTQKGEEMVTANKEEAERKRGGGGGPVSEVALHFVIYCSSNRLGLSLHTVHQLGCAMPQGWGGCKSVALGTKESDHSRACPCLALHQRQPN